MPYTSETGGAMKQFETRFEQINVLPLIVYFMDELDLFNLFKKYVRATPIPSNDQYRGFEPLEVDMIILLLRAFVL